MSDTLKDQLATLQSEIAEKMLGSVSTSTTAEPPSTLRVEDFLRAMHLAKMKERQSRVTFVVDLAHDGPMIGYRTETEGQVFELSWWQAQGVHEKWPLKMSKVRSPECAEFMPATVFDRFVPKVLDMPPYDMPEGGREPPAPPHGEGDVM